MIVYVICLNKPKFGRIHFRASNIIGNYNYKQQLLARNSLICFAPPREAFMSAEYSIGLPGVLIAVLYDTY
jgi:hypothetical protein